MQAETFCFIFLFCLYHVSTYSTQLQSCTTWENCSYTDCKKSNYYGCNCVNFIYDPNWGYATSNPPTLYQDSQCVSTGTMYSNIAANPNILNRTCFFMNYVNGVYNLEACPSTTKIAPLTTTTTELITTSTTTTTTAPPTTTEPLVTTTPTPRAQDLQPLSRIPVATGEACLDFFAGYRETRDGWICSGITNTFGCNGTWVRLDYLDIFACPFELGQGCDPEPAYLDRCWLVCSSGCLRKTPCTNLPQNAYYTGTGTNATNCPWVCYDNYLRVDDACVLNLNYTLAPPPPATTQLRCTSFQSCAHCPRIPKSNIDQSKFIWGCSGYEMYEYNAATDIYRPENILVYAQLFIGFCTYWTNLTTRYYCPDPSANDTYNLRCTLRSDCEYCPGTQYPYAYQGPNFIFGCFGYVDQVVLRQSTLEDLPYTDQNVLPNKELLFREFTAGTCIYYANSVPLRCPDRVLTSPQRATTVLLTTTPAPPPNTSVPCSTLEDCDACNVTLPLYMGCSGVLVVYKFRNEGIGLFAPGYTPPSTQRALCVLRASQSMWIPCARRSNATEIVIVAKSQISFAFTVDAAAQFNDTIRAKFQEIIATLLRVQQTNVKVNSAEGVESLVTARRRLLQADATQQLYSTIEAQSNQSSAISSSIASQQFSQDFQAAAAQSGLPTPFLVQNSILVLGGEQQQALPSAAPHTQPTPAPVPTQQWAYPSNPKTEDQPTNNNKTPIRQIDFNDWQMQVFCIVSIAFAAVLIANCLDGPRRPDVLKRPDVPRRPDALPGPPPRNGKWHFDYSKIPHIYMPKHKGHF